MRDKGNDEQARSLATKQITRTRASVAESFAVKYGERPGRGRMLPMPGSVGPGTKTKWEDCECCTNTQNKQKHTRDKQPNPHPSQQLADSSRRFGSHVRATRNRHYTNRRDATRSKDLQLPETEILITVRRVDPCSLSGHAHVDTT